MGSHFVFMDLTPKLTDATIIVLVIYTALVIDPSEIHKKKNVKYYRDEACVFPIMFCNTTINVQELHTGYSKSAQLKSTHL